MSEMIAKCEEYHAWGAPFCWILDPQEQTAWDFIRLDIGHGKSAAMGALLQS